MINIIKNSALKINRIIFYKIYNRKKNIFKLLIIFNTFLKKQKKVKNPLNVVNLLNQHFFNLKVLDLKKTLIKKIFWQTLLKKINNSMGCKIYKYTNIKTIIWKVLNLINNYHLKSYLQIWQNYKENVDH